MKVAILRFVFKILNLDPVDFAEAVIVHVCELNSPEYRNDYDKHQPELDKFIKELKTFNVIV